MRSSHNRSKRRAEDDEVTPLSASREESHARLSHYSQRSDGYTSSSKSNRDVHDMNTEASSSRSHRGEEGWRSSEDAGGSHERHSYSTNDTYRRNSRDEHDLPRRRDSEGWTGRSSDDARRSSGREWTRREESRHESRRDITPEPYNSPHAEILAPPFDHWRAHGIKGYPGRPGSPDDEAFDDKRRSRDGAGWQDRDRRDNDVDDWRKDGRGSNGHRGQNSRDRNNPNNNNRWNSRQSDENRRRDRTAEERSWEPAPGWQGPSHDQQGQRYQQGRRNNNKNNKGKKNMNRAKQQKRDWRADDGNLNNWTRRDVNPSPTKSARPPAKRRHARSYSRSPSRSPAESWFSPKSAKSSPRGRSLSRSPTPKRRWRDDTPPRSRSRSLSDRERPARQKRRASPPSPAYSRRSYESRGSRRSLSSYYSSSRSRSRSRSFSRSPERPKVLHRLPPATTLKDIPAPVGKGLMNHALPMRPPRDTGSHRNGAANGKGGKRRQSFSERHDPADGSSPAKPAHSARTPEPAADDSNHAAPPMPPISAPRRIETAAGRPGGGKGAGFKPIGRTSSTLKRFFPGDDDDSDAEPLAPERGPPQHDTRLQHAVRHSQASPPHDGRSEYPARRPQASPPYEAHHSSGGWGQLEGGPPQPDTRPQRAVRHHQASPPHNGRSEYPARRPQASPPYEARHYSGGWGQLESPALGQLEGGWGQQAAREDTKVASQDAVADDGSSPRWSPAPEWQRPAPAPAAADHFEKASATEAVAMTAAGAQQQLPAGQASAGPPPAPASPSALRRPMIIRQQERERRVHAAAAAEPARAPSPAPAPHGELYAIVSQVGEGTFGKVYKARNAVTRVCVALKRIRMETERDGFPVTAMREIKLLQSLRHENVVRLYEMMVSNGSVYMVFEYMDHDLTGILSQTQFAFTAAHLKSLCAQMLSGLGYLHHKGVVHRDIKGSNILLNSRGELKLADFGLARFYQKRRRSDYTNRVITLWYRPPELLFGATVYGPEVDMWSAGCIMLELFTKKPVFQGNDEIHQLEVVYRIFGTPTPERWPGLTDLPWYELIKPKDVIPNHFRELFSKWLSPAALDLAEQLLAYDPEQRVSAAQALRTPYFLQEQPAPEMPVGLSTLEGEWHELETKRERAKKRRKTEAGGQ